MEEVEALNVGIWILPKPDPKKNYVKIPRLSRFVPYGYKVDEEDPEWFAPIPLELEALEKAKQYLKQYSLRQVAAWLTKVTGREISHVGLMKRIKSEQSQRRKTSAYRQLARRYKEALEKAEEFEKRIGTAQEDNYFATDEYRRVSDTFSRSTIE
jgi:hypothetical protein